MIHGTLLISDYRASRLITWGLSEEPGALGAGSADSFEGAVSGDVAETPRPGVLAEHAGFLRLPGSGPFAAAYADDRLGRLVLLDRAGRIRSEVPIAIPAEHMAVSDCGSFLAITTGCGMNMAPFSDLLTVVDLRAEVPDAVRIRVRVGEPGVALVRGDDDAPYVLLRHRGEMTETGEFTGPGAVEVLPVQEILAAGPHVPQLSGELTEEIAPDGHGEVYDPVSRTVFCSTGQGLERFQVRGGRPVPLGITPWPVPGRAFYLRFEPVSRRIWCTVRGGPADPTAWDRWTNWVMSAPVSADGEITPEVHHLPEGLAFRLDVASGWAAGTVISPGGDTIWIAEAENDGVRVQLGSLSPMSRPPQPGHAPWDAGPEGSAQRRAVAVLAELDAVAVTSGGDGRVELHRRSGHGVVEQEVLDLGEVLRDSDPAPLDEGGHMIWLPAQARSEVDLIGR